MDANYLDEILRKLNENQVMMKNSLAEALLRSDDDEEKERINKILKFNEQIETAIANKDLNSLQKLYSDAGSN